MSYITKENFFRTVTHLTLFCATAAISINSSIDQNTADCTQTSTGRSSSPDSETKNLIRQNIRSRLPNLPEDMLENMTKYEYRQTTNRWKYLEAACRRSVSWSRARLP